MCSGARAIKIWPIISQNIVNTSGKAGAQIPHLPLGDDSSPWEIMQYAGNLTRFTWMCVTSHSQPRINTIYKMAGKKILVNNN
jgi:hypothetical protein